ncbi:MAG TPA: radical SAM protein, partial [Syntrophomonas sp.]|nr:radical SAM protein [Syntrophomonas sp.]
FRLTHLYNENYFEHVENQMKHGTSQLILELTGSCNMRCRYCIYHDGYPQNRSFTSKRMSKETALNAIAFIKEHGDRQEAFITFYGGEPLLEFNLLRDVIEYAKNELNERKLFFSFTTNLSLLTAEMAEYLATVGNLSAMCSIDGPKEIHDAHRIYANGKGSFDDVYRNFRLLNEKSREHGNSINISANAVYMPPFSYEKVEAINCFFSSMDFTQEDFSYQIGYAAPGTVPEELLTESYYGDDSYRKWQDIKFQENFDLKQVTQSGLLTDFERVHNRMVTKKANSYVPFNGCCVPGFRRLYVTTEGEFTPCERIGNCPTIGNIEQGIDKEDIYKNYIYAFSHAWESHCADCWAAKLCSGCYVGRMSQAGVTQFNQSGCKYNRDNIERNLENYHFLLRNSPEKLGILNSIQTR